MKIQRKMPEHIKDTYKLLCGKQAGAVADWLYLTYKEQGMYNGFLGSYLYDGTMSERAKRAGIVKKLFFDAFNVYNPKYEEYFPDVDWSDYELDCLEKITK